MFKFGFCDEEKGDLPGQDIDNASGTCGPNRPALQEHAILGPPVSTQESELVPLSLCGQKMLFLNGDLVMLRLQRQGMAGDLGRASEAHTDLIPDVYEGGMKLWECSRDLVTFLSAGEPLEGRHVLELGCGAALPAVFCLLRGAASVTVQDYNREVIDHLTVPNLRLNVPESRLAGCRALSGDWAALADRLRAEPGRPRAHLVLTSETIYRRASWPRLLDAVDAGLADGGTALVAAKTFYFGVGGGTRAFEQAVLEDGRFSSEVVFSTKQGLHREILRLVRTT
ncbi:histidine protein methyltransferase 1 homolog [Amphibalanus amphitrite]|uniref:histidine protein methyltransferase 1 homolog n=1 Tax=Amphibalanus amphitrite TaxID=1232801 RepID=UPI001C91D601|nr:histidine protein methyltransferase 1 homolog [Amphibalanus amphitrite]XP_043208621.1 histidine protein methyltransferase 1 homolog [Amphibalanus amphitrite]XP_043208622.1 histidine protein methyltransferase 1 homolog [Amphibalanus amphitrite]XP_043208623.1 histidine protein methyltransferase 1 homolog [Amphibalanus amphitrite]XP_043208624.1 histidine protein methyltransferase 1 homolog [Amphibalanus amphitrite]